MSASEQSRQVKLTVRTADPETEILVQDGRLQVQARGTGSLTTALDEGLYKLKLRTGLDVFEDHLVLQGESPIVKEYPLLGFKSPVPLVSTTRTHEYHMDAATQHSRNAHVVLGQESSLFVFAREWTAPERTFGSKGTHPAAGLSLRTLDPTDLNGQLLVDFETASAVDYQGDPWAACNVRLNPGVYCLRLAVPGGETVEQAVVASPGWQTQVFLLQRQVSPPQEGTGARQEAAPSGTGWCPDLSGASVLMARGEGFAVDDRAARHAELARLGLVGRRRVVPVEVREMLRQKSENPMLGIFGAQLLLKERTRDIDLLRVVVSNLRRLIGNHPDVEAMALEIEDPGNGQAFPVPPMLRQSWRLIVQGTLKRSDLVPPGSFAARIAERILREDLWLMWRSPAEAEDETDDEPSAVESVVESYVRPRRRPSKGLRMRGEVSFGLETPSFDLAVQEPVELDDSKLSALMQSLELPRAQVEQIVEKVRQRPRSQS